MSTTFQKYAWATVGGAGVLLLGGYVWFWGAREALGLGVGMGSVLQGTPSLYGVVGAAVFCSFMLAYLHERIPRCNSSLWERAWRFAALAWFLMAVPSLGMLQLYTQVSPQVLALLGVGSLLDIFLASLVVIPVLYHFPAPSAGCSIGGKH